MKILREGDVVLAVLGGGGEAPSHLAVQAWCAHPAALADKAWLLHPGTAHASQGLHLLLLEPGQEPPQDRVLQGSHIIANVANLRPEAKIESQQCKYILKIRLEMHKN